MDKVENESVSDGEQHPPVKISDNSSSQGAIVGFSAEKSIHEAKSTEKLPSEPDAATVFPTQLTISFGGSVSVFDGIPAEKIQEILRIAAAAAAKANEAKNSANISPVPSPTLNRAPSFSSTSTAASPAAQSFPIPFCRSASFCRSAADLPIARRHSLQRFLKKRRDRVENKNPYSTSDIKKADVPTA